MPWLTDQKNLFKGPYMIYVQLLFMYLQYHIHIYNQFPKFETFRSALLCQM